MTSLAVTEPFETTARDGAVLRGVLWPGEASAVVLLHDDGTDLDSLEPLARALVGDGWTVLALDRRGHGASDGVVDADTPEREQADVGAVLDVLRSRGHGTLCLVAVGSAATTGVGMRREPSVAAVALVSPGPPIGSIPMDPTAEAPVLIVVGGLDGSAADTAEALSRQLTGYTAVSRWPASDQGAELLRGPLGAQVVDQVRVFLARHRRW